VRDASDISIEAQERANEIALGDSADHSFTGWSDDRDLGPNYNGDLSVEYMEQCDAEIQTPEISARLVSPV